MTCEIKAIYPVKFKANYEIAEDLVQINFFVRQSFCLFMAQFLQKSIKKYATNQCL